MAGYTNESDLKKQTAPLFNDPYGSWAEVQKYFGMASDVQSYYNSVSREIEDAQAQPGYKTSKELKDYVSGLLTTLKKVKDTYGSSSVATPGINPNAQTNGVIETGSTSWTDKINDMFKGTLTEDIVKSGREAVGLPEDGAGDWLGGKLTNGGLILLGIVVIGVAVAFTARKQVVQVVTGLAKDAIAG
jgi:hypothetical protein